MTVLTIQLSGHTGRRKVEKSKPSPDRYWAEVRSPSPGSATIHNILRRILENYFKILGGLDTDTICAKFQGKDKLVCKALLSWLNDGSHYVHDPIFVSPEESSAETFFRVFKEIFRLSDNLGHYDMMMAAP